MAGKRERNEGSCCSQGSQQNCYCCLPNCMVLEPFLGSKDAQRIQGRAFWLHTKYLSRFPLYLSVCITEFHDMLQKLFVGNVKLYLIYGFAPERLLMHHRKTVISWFILDARQAASLFGCKPQRLLDALCTRTVGTGSSKVVTHLSPANVSSANI